MRENNEELTLSLKEFIGAETTDCLEQLVEAGIDSMMDEGMLQGIPFISTAVSIVRIGKGLREWHNIKKLAAFLDEIRRQTVDAEKLDAYRAKLSTDAKTREKELTYILVLIDRYIDVDKPRILASLYLAYLEGNIDWSAFVTYVEVIEKLLSVDIKALMTMPFRASVRPGAMGEDTLLRLSATGVLCRKDNSMENYQRAKKMADRGIGSLGSMFEVAASHEYELTHFGRKLQGLIK